MQTKLHQIPYMKVGHYPEGLSEEKAMDSFRELCGNAYEVCTSSLEITNRKPSSSDERKKIEGQSRRRLRASEIFRQIRTNKSTGFSIHFNDAGNVSGELIWKGQGIRTANIDGMGVFCDCPDNDRDYKLCKHKLSLAGLVVAAGNDLDSIEKEPDFYHFDDLRMQEIYQGMDLLRKDIVELRSEMGKAWEFFTSQDSPSDQVRYEEYLSCVERLLSDLGKCQHDLGWAMDGMNQLGRVRSKLGYSSSN